MMKYDERVEFVCMCCMEYRWRNAKQKSGWICPYLAKHTYCPVVEHVYLREQDPELSWKQMQNDLEKNMELNKQRMAREAAGEKTVHKMKLLPAHFDAVEQGIKTVEMRLDDAKRRWVREGDLIEFSSNGEPERTVLVEVLKKTVFVGFAELVEEYGSVCLGFADQSQQKICEYMESLYDERKLKASHAIAIEFRVCNNE